MSEQPPPPARIVVTRNGQTFGPYAAEEVRQYLAAGQLLPGDMAKLESATSWQPLAGLMGLAPLQGPGAPPEDIGDNAGVRLLLPVGRSGWAIAAGYLGLFGLVIAPAPLALIVSLIAIWHIRKHRNDPHPKHGMGRALFGLIVGLLGTGLILYFVLSSYMKWEGPRRHAGRTGACQRRFCR